MLHRRRPPEHGRDPRADGPQPRSRARLRVGHDRRQAVPRSRSRSATASWPRRPTSSSRCRRCSTTGSARAGSRSPSSAPRRSTASRTSTRTVIGDYDHAADAPAGRRRRAGDRRSAARRSSSSRRIRRARSSPSSTSARPAARHTTSVITDLGVLEPRDGELTLTAAASRGRAPTQVRDGDGLGPAGRRRACAPPSRPTDRELEALRELARPMTRRLRLRRRAHAVRPLRRRARRACGPTTSARTSCARSSTARPQLDPARIDDVLFGDANGAGEDNRDVARMAVLLAGLPTSVPGATRQPALRLRRWRPRCRRAARSRPATRR